MFSNRGAVERNKQIAITAFFCTLFKIEEDCSIIFKIEGEVNTCAFECVTDILWADSGYIIMFSLCKIIHSTECEGSNHCTFRDFRLYWSITFIVYTRENYVGETKFTSG